MDALTIINRHKGIRRFILALCCVWITCSIAVGLYVMLTRSLTAADSNFLIAVVALLQVPIGFYFWKRGK